MNLLPQKRWAHSELCGITTQKTVTFKDYMLHKSKTNRKCCMIHIITQQLLIKSTSFFLCQFSNFKNSFIQTYRYRLCTAKCCICWSFKTNVFWIQSMCDAEITCGSNQSTQKTCKNSVFLLLSPVACICPRSARWYADFSVSECMTTTPEYYIYENWKQFQIWDYQPQRNMSSHKIWLY
jgi:hypothetical protein